jgi:hypothetical protein
MKSFFQFLNEIAADSQSMVSSQPISALIQRNFPMGALNYDFSEIPPTAKNKKPKHRRFYKLENSEFLKISIFIMLIYIIDESKVTNEY